MFYKIISIFIFITFTFVFFIFGLIFILITLLLPNKYMYSYLNSFCYLVLCSLGAIPKTNQPFPEGQQFIVMFNHSSFIDAFIFGYSVKGKLTGVIAKENLKYPLFGYLCRRFNAIAIDRKNKKSALESMKNAERTIKQGYSIGILPEGTRTVSGKMGPLKKGGFHMAINTRIPILPVGIVGAYNYKPKNRWWFKPQIININYGTPIHPNTYNKLGIEGLMREVSLQLKTLSEEK